MSARRIVIVGAGDFAQIACLYFEQDTEYEVAGFAVERAFLTESVVLDRPVVALEEVESHFPPDSHDAHVAIVFNQLNRVRSRLIDTMRQKGYGLASYVSPHAFIGPRARLGEHVFVFENNVIQPFVEIGNNVVLWSGNHIGHHTVIEDNVFVASHVVVSGNCRVGSSSFLGVNAAVANGIDIARDCWIGPGVTISRPTKPGELFRPPEAEIAKVDTYRYFKVPRPQETP